MFYKKKEKRNKASSNQIYELTLGAYHYDTRRNIPCAFFIKHKTIKFDQVANGPLKLYINQLTRLRRAEKLHCLKSLPPFSESSQTELREQTDFPTGLSGFSM